MKIKKTILSTLFIAVFSGSMLPISSVENAKEGSVQLKELKKQILCWKKKEGCSKKQIATIIAGVVGLIAVMSGITWYGIRKRPALSAPTFPGRTPLPSRDPLNMVSDPAYQAVIQGIVQNPEYVIPDVPSRAQLSIMGDPRESVADKAYNLLKPSFIKIAEEYGTEGGLATLNAALMQKLMAAGFDSATAKSIGRRLITDIW